MPADPLSHFAVQSTLKGYLCLNQPFTTMSSLYDRITLNPDICHGKPTIRNKRYTVDLILDLLASGMSTAEILDDYPALEKEDIQACLAYASRLSRVSSYANIA